MYAGKIVEQADVKPLFGNPLHPYTVGLLGSIPKLTEQQDRLQVIEGVYRILPLCLRAAGSIPGAKKPGKSARWRNRNYWNIRQVI